MTPDEMGLVYNALVQYRMIETKPSGKRQSKKGEAKAAEILSAALDDEYHAFKEFLKGQGFILKKITSDTFPNVSEEAFCLIFVGMKSDDCVELFSSKLMIEELKKTRIFGRISKDISAWWMVLWLVHLTFLYAERDWREASKFSKRTIKLQDFSKRMLEYLDEAQSNINAGNSSWLAHALVGTDSNQRLDNISVDRICGQFLKILEENRLLESVDETNKEYRQTLLGGIDLKLKFEQDLRFIFPRNDTLLEATEALEIKAN